MTESSGGGFRVSFLSLIEESLNGGLVVMRLLILRGAIDPAPQSIGRVMKCRYSTVSYVTRREPSLRRIDVPNPDIESGGNVGQWVGLKLRYRDWIFLKIREGADVLAKKDLCPRWAIGRSRLEFQADAQSIL